MRKITKLNLMRTLRATGAFSFIPEGRTYSPLVTQAVVSFPKVRLVRSPRGKNPIGFYGLLRKPMDNAAFLRKRHHCPRSCQHYSLRFHSKPMLAFVPTARINLPPAALFAVMGSQTATPSSFAKRSKTGTRGR